MNASNPASEATLQLRLSALEIDLHSALALTNALLRGMSATAPHMHHAIDQALGDALRAIVTENRRGSAAVHAVVMEVRERLRTETGLHDRMARDLERLIIDRASALPDAGGVVIEGDFEGRRPRRPESSSI